MQTTLSLPKQSVIIKHDWDWETLLLDKEIDRARHIKNKDVITIDWIIFNCAYISKIKPLNATDDVADTAMARAKKQVWAFAPVAVERVRTYEATQWNKMSIDKITKWMQWFCERWYDRKEDQSLSKFYKIFIQAWWTDDMIWW